jgi:hypothetical protein
MLNVEPLNLFSLRTMRGANNESRPHLISIHMKV